jgi:hypothetical protein
LGKCGGSDGKEANSDKQAERHRTSFTGGLRTAMEN